MKVIEINLNDPDSMKRAIAQASGDQLAHIEDDILKMSKMLFHAMAWCQREKQVRAAGIKAQEISERDLANMEVKGHA